MYLKLFQKWSYPWNTPKSERTIAKQIALPSLYFRNMSLPIWATYNRNYISIKQFALSFWWRIWTYVFKREYNVDIYLWKIQCCACRSCTFIYFFLLYTNLCWVCIYVVVSCYSPISPASTTTAHHYPLLNPRFKCCALNMLPSRRWKCKYLYKWPFYSQSFSLIYSKR